MKFKNGPTDLTKIEIVLTDFGMAESDSKGGTPVFASPECFENKQKKSDVFSFGRVILFLLLSKEQFMKWLFVPIKDQTRVSSLNNLTTVNPLQLLNLVSEMTSVSSRISLRSARRRFNQLRRDARIKLNSDLIAAIESIVNAELSNDFGFYVSELCDLRYKIISRSQTYNLF